MYSELYFSILSGDCGSLFFEENIFKALLYLFFYPEIDNLNNSETVGSRKLPDPSMNKNFNVLSFGLQYTLSFKQPDLDLKCLAAIKPKVQSLKFKAYV